MSECLIPVGIHSRSPGNAEWKPTVTVTFRNGDSQIGLIVPPDSIHATPEGWLLQVKVLRDLGKQIECETPFPVKFQAPRALVVGWKR